MESRGEKQKREEMNEKEMFDSICLETRFSMLLGEEPGLRELERALQLELRWGCFQLIAALLEQVRDQKSFMYSFGNHVIGDFHVSFMCF